MALNNKKNNTVVGTDSTPDLYAYLEGDDTNIMETPKKISSREKKLIQLSGKFGELGTQAQNGFLMGAAVGGAMGAMIGIWSALQTKKLILLPISILTSGGFFGFIMMCGSIVRSDTDSIYCHLDKQNKHNISSQKEEDSSAVEIREPPFWQIKYS